MSKLLVSEKGLYIFIILTVINSVLIGLFTYALFSAGKSISSSDLELKKWVIEQNKQTVKESNDYSDQLRDFVTKENKKVYDYMDKVTGNSVQLKSDSPHNTLK